MNTDQHKSKRQRANEQSVRDKTPGSSVQQSIARQTNPGYIWSAKENVIYGFPFDNETWGTKFYQPGSIEYQLAGTIDYIAWAEAGNPARLSDNTDEALTAYRKEYMK